MADNHYHETYRETRPAKSGTGTIAFIVGGLVVAVGLILFWLFGGVDAVNTTGETAPNVEINATSGSDAASQPAATQPTDDAGSTAGSSAGTGSADAEAGSSANVGTQTGN